MPTPQQLEENFWKALKSDRTVMLGIDRFEDHVRPMTAMFEEAGGPIWFFTSRENTIVEHAGKASPATATFAAKDHKLFATIEGRLQVDMDRAVIDRLWNPFIAAWYEGGKEDPKLVLLRFDADEAKIWENENNLFAGLKMLLGVDPKKDYADKVATVAL
ncbi:pyridoxamine 5'-phosphate oxidase family protein [Sandaracinobacteroides hominis]|uniref:pyridoxamine 5'-phosphate oxidase family protein n=1 Tax=Sandaracinobacteroides hominis TaxID=2780086 RepID=UPI0018F34AF6|nr:pyridoxamine 5'-phosphate oxidase family protein [Sandaracinobacteroides hominis]